MVESRDSRCSWTPKTLDSGELSVIWVVQRGSRREDSHVIAE